jgi:nucleobase transporter 1/2
MNGNKEKENKPFLKDDEVFSNETKLYYSVDERPPWVCCILLGFQQFLTALSGQISIPLILAPALCMDRDLLGLSWIIGTYLMVGGISTCLQSTFGVRYAF